MKPMLAEDVVSFETLRYPLYGSFKIDGVRAVMPDKTLLPRSLKQFGNTATVKRFSKDWKFFTGLDGELTLGDNPAAPNLCRATTSAMSSYDGEPDIHWWIFDLLIVASDKLRFADRVSQLRAWFKDRGPNELKKLKVHLVEQKLIRNAAEAEAFEQEALSRGYEGIILKDPDGVYKYGRSTLKSQQFLRVKRFADAEGEVIGFAERMKNNNEATINALGHQTRSSHKANKAGADTLGNLEVKIVTGPFKGATVEIGTGFDAATARAIWLHQDDLLGKLVKFSYFPHGCKDKPRFPVFLGFRDPVDLG